MKQLSFFFNVETATILKGLVKRCAVIVKKRYPSPTAGETLEEYNIFLRDETLLEISQQLRNIALKRQKMAIEAIYKGKYND